MAKKSSTERNDKRKKMIASYANKRAKYKAVTSDRSLSFEERLDAQVKLGELPRNSSKVRHRNRCGVTGRSRGYYRKFDMSRISLRELGNFGEIPGLIKASW